MYMQTTLHSPSRHAAPLTGVVIAPQRETPLAAPARTVEQALRAVRLVRVPTGRAAKHAVRADRVADRQVLWSAANHTRIFPTGAASPGSTCAAAPALAPGPKADLSDRATHLAGERLAASDAFAARRTVARLGSCARRVEGATARHTRSLLTKTTTCQRAVMLLRARHQNGALVEGLSASRARHQHRRIIPHMRCLIRLVTDAHACEIARRRLAEAAGPLFAEAAG
jgi:hypothetical protein